MPNRTLDQAILSQVNKNQSFSFFNKLPNAIVENIFLPYLNLENDNRTTSNLACISKSPASVLFREHQQVKQLLQAVIYGEKNKVENILASHPESLEKLLTTPMKVMDYSGREIDGTALQLALGAEDISRPKHPNEGMADMISQFLDTLPQGTAIKKAQIEEQFPSGWEIEEAKRKREDLKALARVTHAITTSPLGNCEAALAEFREYLRPKNLIKKGKHFNADLLAEAFKLYIENYNPFHYVRNVLYWINVVGYIQRFLPASYAQAYCMGAYNFLNRNMELKRSLELEDDVYFFPLVPDRGVGYEYVAMGITFRNWQDTVSEFINMAKTSSESKTKMLQRLIKEANGAYLHIHRP